MWNQSRLPWSVDPVELPDMAAAVTGDPIPTQSISSALEELGRREWGGGRGGVEVT